MEIPRSAALLLGARRTSQLVAGLHVVHRTSARGYGTGSGLAPAGRRGGRFARFGLWAPWDSRFLVYRPNPGPNRGRTVVGRGRGTWAVAHPPPSALRGALSLTFDSFERGPRAKAVCGFSYVLEGF